MRFMSKAIVAGVLGAVSLGTFGSMSGLGPLAMSTPLTAQSYSPAQESIWRAAGFGAAIAIGDGEIFVGRTRAAGWLARSIPRPAASTSSSVLTTDGSSPTSSPATTSEIGDGFGAALAVDGDRLLVGSPGRDDGWGGAYLFERGD